MPQAEALWLPERSVIFMLAVILGKKQQFENPNQFSFWKGLFFSTE